MAPERLLDRGTGVEHPGAKGIPFRFHGGVGEHHRVASPGDRHLIELAAVFPAVRDRGGRDGVAETGGPEQHGLAVRREGGRRLIVLVPRQPLGVTPRGRHREDVHGSEAVGRESDRAAVRRPDRGDGVEPGRRQGDRVAARRRRGPDLPGIPERDAGSVGREGRIAQPERRGSTRRRRGWRHIRIGPGRRAGHDGTAGQQDEGEAEVAAGHGRARRNGRSVYVLQHLVVAMTTLECPQTTASAPMRSPPTKIVGSRCAIPVRRRSHRAS